MTDLKHNWKLFFNLEEKMKNLYSNVKELQDRDDLESEEKFFQTMYLLSLTSKSKYLIEKELGFYDDNKNYKLN